MLSRNPNADAAITIPTRWLNTVIGLFLLPVAWLFTAALFSAFTHAARQGAFWRTEEFLYFTLGAAGWLIVFCASFYAFGEPRPLRVYVFGHELTHAIWAQAMGGKVFAFEHSREGGFIVTDKHNFWIALSPYFHPLYAVLVIAAYGAASVFYDLSAYTPALFALLGLTWSFHLSFTIWMIIKGQSDLTVNGTFFSLILIYLLNLILLTAVLIFVAPEVTFAGFTKELGSQATVLADALMTLVSGFLEGGAGSTE